MPVDKFNLTKDKHDLPHVLWRHAQRAESQLMIRRINWLLAWYYLNGYRRFNVYDPTTGYLQPHYLDAEGKIEYQSTKLLFAINQVAGRIQSMDMRPQCEAQGISLGTIRNRALCQITADAVVSQNSVDRIKEQYAFTYACLGFAGITGHMDDHPSLGLTSDLEVIHPRELFPFPIQGQDPTKVLGIMRQRIMPLDQLRDQFGNKKVNSWLDQMDWYEKGAGDIWLDRDPTDTMVPGMTPSMWWDGQNVGGGAPSGAKDTTAVVKVRELWMLGPSHTCYRYVCSSGNQLIEDHDLGDVESYCPIGWSRFMNNLTFHGAGMFDLLFSIHREMERMQKTLFNNIRDLDRYGILVLPSGTMNQNTILKDVGHGLRVMFWEPDPVNEGFNPFPIQPFNSGDVPGRVAELASAAMDQVNPIQDIIQEKGRVDSASGLSFLDEQMQKALTTPTLGVALSWGDAYRSLIQKASQRLTASKQTIPVQTLTLDMAGAIIDPDTDKVSFANNPIPTVSTVRFTIKNMSPRSESARKQEAIQLWEKGLEQDPVAFRLFALKDGIDFAFYKDDFAGAYQATVRDILILYNDGETPGFIAPTPETCKAELALRVVSDFMVGPVMRAASPDVIDAFAMYRQTLMNFMGLTLPNAVPNPDDAAMLSGMGGGMSPSPSPEGMQEGPPLRMAM